MPILFGAHSLVDKVSDDYLQRNIPESREEASMYVNVVDVMYTPAELDKIIDAFYKHKSSDISEEMWFVYELSGLGSLCGYKYIYFYEYPTISSSYLIENSLYYGRLAFPNWYSVPLAGLFDPNPVEVEDSCLTIRLRLHGKKWQQQTVMALNGLAELISKGGWMEDIETYILKHNAGGNFRYDQWKPRAVGLWLWDYVNRNKCTQIAAIQAFEETGFLAPLGMEHTEDSDLRFYFRCTKECIDAAEVLPFTKKGTVT